MRHNAQNGLPIFLIVIKVVHEKHACIEKRRQPLTEESASLPVASAGARWPACLRHVALALMWVEREARRSGVPRAGAAECTYDANSIVVGWEGTRSCLRGSDSGFPLEKTLFG